MLARLYVKNVALISEADIVFDGKLNILSGETGSGKSVILDSINFVLGSKADKSMIRYGENEATVRAEFIVSEQSEAAKQMRGLDIETDGTIVITRKFTVDGKGSIKLNGNSVTAAMLKKVTQHLVDVHGQSEHFVLLNEANQLNVLDNLCGESLVRAKEQLAVFISRKKEIENKIKSLGGNEQERERELDLLDFQIKEIDAAELREGEYDELIAKRNLIANVEKVLGALNAVSNIMNADGGCVDGISSAKRCINPIADLDKEYENIAERLESLAAEAEDIAETVNDLSDGLNFDGQEAEYVEERLALIKRLRKKYGASEKEILQFRDQAAARYDELVNSAEMLEKCNAQVKEADGEIYRLCRQMTVLRKQCADLLCGDVEKELQSLNIPDAKFRVSFASYDENTANYRSANGSDGVQFCFSANKGEPLKPLNKVISGGEMSRFMLALKTKLKSLNGISTYIFDEIDAGISGVTARKVAEKFIEISKDTQIIAVSHLPQVCAASDSQFLIYKTEENGKTLTRIDRLDPEQKIDEIIRLTGNIKSDSARRYAVELIEQYKKS